VTEFRFRVEMAAGQDHRIVEADAFVADGAWLIFFRQGQEYWRANLSLVVSMESVPLASTGTSND
jgi:hypothetical protein